MNKELTTYKRKISSTEAENDYIFILKNKLSFFPPIGGKFELFDDGSSKEVEVESYPCNCRGPDFPHEHYFIRWTGLKSGDIIEILKSEKNEYKIHVES